MQKKRKILIVTGNKYPEGDAGAIRQHAFAKLINSCGFEPVIFGMGNSTGFKLKEYEGIKYYSLRYNGSSIFIRALGRLLFSNNLRRLFSKYNKKTIAGILIVSGDRKTFNYVKRVARKFNYPLFHDSVEWYSPCEFSNGEKNWAYKFNNDLNTKIIDKEFKVIAISSYLYNHYKKKGNSALRIPVILDVSQLSCKKELSTDYIRILYAGTLSKKDHLKELIEAVAMLDDEQRKCLRIDVIGVTKEEYFSIQSVDDKNNLSDNIYFYGRVPHDIVLNHLTRSDFTVLLRPSNERYAKAGFPTKVVESLASGTPVLCNYSSDLNLYLNKKNAIIVDECSKEACYDGLKRILSLSVQERRIMQNEARLTAENHFDYRKYIDDFERFLNS